EAGDRRGRQHGEVVGERDSGRIVAEQRKQQWFQRMVRAGRIAWGGTDAAVGFADQVDVGKVLRGRIAPEVFADVLVKAFGEGFGEAVGQRFQQNVGIIVVLRAETVEMRL